ncbi:MAG: GreA/GreB family elongation factor [bacterium]
MSKAFTKDEAWEEPVVAPRAPLPPDVPNYVTPRGLAALRSELAGLEALRQPLDASAADDPEQRRRQAIAGKRLSDLTTRLASAQLVDPRQQPHDTVRFGAIVVLRTLDGGREGEERRLQIVGVDEADAAHGRVAFVAPIARAVLGLAAGETATLHAARGDELLEVMSIEYADDGELEQDH